MTLAGWVLLVVSLTFVWGLLIWCYRRILTSGKPVDEGPDLL